MIQETISSNNAPVAVGPYSPAVRAGDFIYISGQLPIDPTTGQLVSDDIRIQTEQVLKNIDALLAEAGLNMSYVLKTTVFVKNMEEFAAMNEVYSRFFQKPFPARSAVAVKDIAFNAKVESEAFAMDTRALEVLCAEDGCHTCNDYCCETKLDIQ